MALIREIIENIEALAPLRLQEDYDNSGWQVAPDRDFGESEAEGVLVCLDVTEAIIEEARAKGCNLIVSHHPLIFKPFTKVIGESYQQNCAISAIKNGIGIYSAHTNLDNAKGGVNFKIVEKLHLSDLEWLEPRDADSGSGLVGNLPSPVTEKEFLLEVKNIFHLKVLQHSPLRGRKISRVALCGGSGSFLLQNAIDKGADVFLTGEMSYHHFFDTEGIVALAAGHYESEQYTVELLAGRLNSSFKGLKVVETEINTNPIEYL